MFSISQDDRKKIDEWLHSIVYPPILEQQKEDPDISQFIFTDKHGREIPYFGAIGGELTYSFTPTGLGEIVKVECRGNVLDLTDYDSW